MQVTVLDLSTYAGIIAICLLTGNILLGLLISVKFNTRKHFPYYRINIFKIHNWTGYIALCAVVLHAVLLLFSATAGFHLLDVVFPIWSPVQPFENTLGALALYLLTMVVATSYFRVELGRKRWKFLHYFAYAAAVIFFIHGLFTDPNLENRPLDPFDAEKVLVEMCMLAVSVGIVWRTIYALQQRRTKTVRK